jgi:nucleotide-binding universal stress UspA family protein
MKILLPVDGSEYSNKAVGEVVRRPWPFGTQVEVLSVAQPVPEFPDTQLMGHTVYLDSLERETKRAQKNVAETAATITQAAPQLAVTTKVLEGTPKEEILREATAWDADLIVMGSHGYGAAMRFLMGSISHAVALHAPCSVEIVRPRKTVPSAKS